MSETDLRLIGLTGHGDFPIPLGRPLLVGRGGGADLVIPDSAVSRTHAEIQATGDRLRVRDLGSANGTMVNGVNVTEALLTAGDTLTFGRPAFRVEQAGTPAESAALAGRGATRTIAPATGDIGDPATLGQLLALAQELAGAVDGASLEALVADLTFGLVPADRVAVLLRQGPDGALVPIQSRSRVGPATAVQVPRALADRAVTEGHPVVTEDALDDATLRSGSVIASRVRSAIAAPMTTTGGEVVGVLYADRISSATPFSDGEARTVLAFAALAGASLARAELGATVRRQDEQRRNLERFLAPEVAAIVAAAGAPLGAGGERRTVSVLFSDIRGFTGLAEQLAPETVAELLTEYFTSMTDQVFAHGGTLDKFLGDGLLAVWGAPFGMPDEAARALDAARAMRADLARLNAMWTARGWPALSVGIGLARGEVFAGRIGSDHRLDYTVIGDTVNVAFKLCAGAGADDILVTEAFRAALPDAGSLTAREDLEIRGRAGVVRVWAG
ncbi:MAG: adenylate/guanylate cyclase domain-containing protein [Gemmatimonadales bacterium]